MSFRLTAWWLCLAGAGLLPALCGAATQGAVRLPHVLGSNMVLQRDLATPVWGWAQPGEKVTVAIAGQEHATQADARGRWLVKLRPLPAGGPHELLVSGSNQIKLENILVGDVWLCSGQSNMRFDLLSATTGKEALAAANLPQIRLFRVPLRAAGQPVEDVDAQWQVCNAQSAERFAAVGFFFGRKLQQELGVPIGLIDSAWSASRVDPWIPPEGFASIPEYPDLSARLAAGRQRWKNELLPWASAQGPAASGLRRALEENTPLPIDPPWPINSVEMNRRHQYTAGREAEIYNGMIYPLVPLGLRGTIWYQGEGNVRAWPLIDYALPDGGLTYATKLRALVNGWRQVWGQGDFPLYFVQLAPCQGYQDDDLPRFWEAQQAALQIPNTGMAVITDVADLTHIHAPRKEEVGVRLALCALGKTYGKDVVYSGPLYQAMSVEGSQIRLRFAYAQGGLASRDGKPLDWFTIAGADQQFVPAQARIDGQSVLVWSDAVAQPAAVRFGWSNLAQPNLINQAGLPAAPFRSDRWDPPLPVHPDAVSAAAQSSAFLVENAKKPGVITLPGGLQYEVLQEGAGPLPTMENQLAILFTASVRGGAIFAAATAAEPATPRIQDTWAPVQQALQLMKVGARWRLYIPPELGHGAAGFGPHVGPNQVLVYDLEVTRIIR